MQIANGVVEKSEASASVPFEAYDANRDGVLSGAEVMRGRVSFVRPLDITYKDKYQIRLSGKRVELSWVGSMNHSRTRAISHSAMTACCSWSTSLLPPAAEPEMDYELRQFEDWVTAVCEPQRIWPPAIPS